MKNILLVLLVVSALSSVSYISYGFYKSNSNRLVASTKQSSPKIKILVIDTGVYPHKKLKKFLPSDTSTQDYVDLHGHGTHVAGIIAFGDLQQSDLLPVCDQVAIHSCRFFTTPDDKNNDAAQMTEKCLRSAVGQGFTFINYSAGGVEKNPDEELVLKQLAKDGAKIITAAGNESELFEYTSYYPAKYDIEGLIPVGNMGHDKKVHGASNFGGGLVYDYGDNIYSTMPNDNMGFMTGTSQAAAMYTHRLVKKKCSQIDPKYKLKLQKEEEKGRIVLYGGKNGKHTGSK